MPEEKKFDFQNIDTKLYIALRNLTKDWVAIAEDAGNRNASDDPDYHAAMLAMEEFELSHGPIPDWAVARNWDYSLVPGAQLCTRDGRRMGNAHIISRESKDYGVPTGSIEVFHCLTDAGAKFTFTEPELLSAFHVGDWISDPQRVIKDFDRNGEFKEEPNGQP